jgi:hypothetical protein
LPDTSLSYVPGERFSLIRKKKFGKTAFGTQRGPGLTSSKLHSFIGRELRELGLNKIRTRVYFCSQPLSQLRKIESCVFGIATNFLLSYPSLFLDENKKTWYSLIRWIFRVGTYSVQEVVDAWKDYVLKVLQLSGNTLLEPRVLKENSWFSHKPLHLNIPEFLQDIEKPSREGYSRIMTLTNSRNLPCGSAKKEKIAIEKHQQNMMRPFQGDPYPLGTVSGGIGLEVKHKVKSAVRYAHISLSGSAAFSCTRAKGGRAKEAADSFRQWASVIATEDVDKVDIFGRIYREATGEPRWKTVYREDPDIFYGRDFLEVDHDTLLDSHIGLDETTGKQLLACADSERILWGDAPIPCRVGTIPEPGGKVRIVTIAPWWVTTLLQPAGHVGLKLIEDLPELGGSATLGDPAFEVQKRLREMLSETDIAKRIQSRELCLYVSDLSEATDHIPHAVAFELLKGLFEGCGLWGTIPYWEIAVRLLVNPRELTYPDGIKVLSRAGILMGDPLTRVGLYLLSIVAIRRVKLQESSILLYAVTAGDDHLAIGNVHAGPALRNAFIEAGAEIQLDKTLQSFTLVKYCEKGIAVGPWTDLKANPFSKVDTSKYLVIDAIKTRLISPETKSRDAEEEANPAFGRIPLLYKNLRWSVDISEPAMRLIPFIYMARFPSGRLPNDFRMLAVPPQWGGLAAYRTTDDIVAGFEALPKYLKASIVKLVLRKAPFQMIRALAAVTKKVAFRGLLRSGLEEIPNEVESLFWHMEPKTIRTIAEEDRAGVYDPPLGLLPYYGLKKIETVLRGKGFLLRNEIPSLLTRAQFFDLVLSGQATCAPSWKIRKWSFRYNEAKKMLVNIWKQEKIPPPGKDEYETAIGLFKYLVIDGIYLDDYAIPPTLVEILVVWSDFLNRKSVGLRGPACWRYAPTADPDCPLSLRKQIVQGSPSLLNVLEPIDD